MNQPNYSASCKFESIQSKSSVTLYVTHPQLNLSIIVLYSPSFLRNITHLSLESQAYPFHLSANFSFTAIFSLTLAQYIHLNHLPNRFASYGKVWNLASHKNFLARTEILKFFELCRQNSNFQHFVQLCWYLQYLDLDLVNVSLTRLFDQVEYEHLHAN